MPNRVFTAVVLLACLAHQGRSQSSAKPVSIEESQCYQYKRAMFEKEYTYGYLIHGGEQYVYVDDRCNQTAVPFIVGGSPANPKEFAFAARLGNRPSRTESPRWFCGGTLISDRFVITAAHCLYASQGAVNVVRLGELDFESNSEDAQPEDFEVSRVISHPSYRLQNREHDIAILELDRPVNMSEYKFPACLPINAGDEFSRFVAVGWGSEKFTQRNSRELRKVWLDSFDYRRCEQMTREIGEKFDARMQICAGSHEAKDTCDGDSGGPLLATHPEYLCMFYVVGITSGGYGGCGTPDVPGVYTRVFPYMQWIRSIVWPE